MIGEMTYEESQKVELIRAEHTTPKPLGKIGKIFLKEKPLMNVDFQLKSDEIHCLVGHNGAGKSTLMKALDPVGGSRHMMRLYYWGQSLEYYASDAEFLRRNIVAVYTTLSDNHLPEKATVSSILKAYEVLNVPFNYDKFEALSQEFHLEYKKPLKDLSTGNQKITAFLLALAREPKILLLDELTANLAPLFKEKVWNLVSEFCTTDTAVLFSTHEESDVRALHPDYITLLSHMNVVQTYDGMSWDDVISAMGQEEDLL